MLRGNEPSAIAKSRRSGSVAVTRLGLEGDEQADRIHHGGVDMAVHHYPRDHYPHWQSRIPAQALLGDAGALGENISTRGLTEREACIGDRFRLGTALVEISQGRKPCWKPAHRLGLSALVGEIVETRRSGWYYRVLEEGAVREGDQLVLVDRPHPEWTVELIFAIIVAGIADEANALTRALSALPPLSDEWRGRCQKRLAV